MVSLLELYNLLEASEQELHRRLTRAALATLEWGIGWAQRRGDKNLAQRAERASARIGKVMDMDRVQDAHLAVILVVGNEMLKQKVRTAVPPKDMVTLIGFARHRLGLAPTSDILSQDDGED